MHRGGAVRVPLSEVRRLHSGFCNPYANTLKVHCKEVFLSAAPSGVQIGVKGVRQINARYKTFDSLWCNRRRWNLDALFWGAK